VRRTNGRAANRCVSLQTAVALAMPRTRAACATRAARGTASSITIDVLARSARFPAARDATQRHMRHARSLSRVMRPASAACRPGDRPTLLFIGAPQLRGSLARSRRLARFPAVPRAQASRRGAAMGPFRACFSARPQYDAAETALRTAAARGDVDGVKTALKRGAHVDCRSDPGDPDTPLFAAVLLSETETAAVLLKAGASVHARNSHGAWPARRGRGRRRG